MRYSRKTLLKHAAWRIRYWLVIRRVLDAHGPRTSPTYDVAVYILSHATGRTEAFVRGALR